MAKQLVIHGSVLGELGNRFSNKTDISPLHQQEKYKDIGQNELIKSNILKTNKELVDSVFESMITKLARPRFFGRYRYTQGVTIKETTVFYDDDNKLICGMTTGEEEIVTLDPEFNIGDDIDQIIQLIGQSVIQYNEFDYELNIMEALSLGAMIDLYRKEMYSSLGKGENFDPIPSQPGEIYEEINNEKAQWIMWLTFIIKQSLATELTCDINDVDKSLKSLVDKNLLEKDGTGYKITKEVEGVAIRMHLTDNIIVANCGFASSSKVNVMSFISAQYGVKDIIMIDASGEMIELSCVSAGQIVKMLMDFMYNPKGFFIEEFKEFIVKEVSEIQTETAKAEIVVEPVVKTKDKTIIETKFCVHCGQKIPRSSKFCPLCGGKTQ